MDCCALLSLAFLIEMGVAIWKVHFKNGLMGNGGYNADGVGGDRVCARLFDGGPWGATVGGRGGRKTKAAS